jgi:uncharacterized phage protein (TIGR01671 family)
MREILFRGKRKDNGEWVSAFSIMKSMIDGEWVLYVGASRDAWMDLDKHYNLVNAETLADCLFYSVHPETIGQFIGLVDRNGTKVFEGDILRPWSSYHESYGEPCVVEYGASNCSCCDGVYGWYLNNGDIRDLDTKNTWYEVVGNIHDNPDLIGGKDGREL